MDGSPARSADGPRPGEGANGLVSERFFSQALRRERAVSERTDVPFAVVALEDRGTPGALEVLQARARRTDVLGRLDRRRIGLLLRSCGIDDARRVAIELEERLEAIGLTPSITIYPYPPLLPPAPVTPGASGGVPLEARYDPDTALAEEDALAPDSRRGDGRR